MKKIVESILIKISAIIIILILIIIALPVLIVGSMLLAIITLIYFLFQIGKKEDDGTDRPV
jgi:hypothetical protein